MQSTSKRRSRIQHETVEFQRDLADKHYSNAALSIFKINFEWYLYKKKIFISKCHIQSMALIFFKNIIILSNYHMIIDNHYILIIKSREGNSNGVGVTIEYESMWMNIKCIWMKWQGETVENGAPTRARYNQCRTNQNHFQKKLRRSVGSNERRTTPMNSIWTNSNSVISRRRGGESLFTTARYKLEEVEKEENRFKLLNTSWVECSFQKWLWKATGRQIQRHLFARLAAGARTATRGQRKRDKRLRGLKTDNLSVIFIKLSQVAPCEGKKRMTKSLSHWIFISILYS